ncbi:hypothetical protein QVD17_38872 [Tagetes erecta]|uniref:Uncharacterized protein n=1 Tax=Tagetes erecta TaxID=13708 RepID=A0AAD8JNZ4_TARER|nr:hypothetical protein QVD17_38872 [Tagetes erecta]
MAVVEPKATYIQRSVAINNLNTRTTTCNSKSDLRTSNHHRENPRSHRSKMSNNHRCVTIINKHHRSITTGSQIREVEATEKQSNKTPSENGRGNKDRDVATSPSRSPTFSL